MVKFKLIFKLTFFRNNIIKLCARHEAKRKVKVRFDCYNIQFNYYENG